MWVKSLAAQGKLAQKALEKEKAKVAAEAKKNAIAKAKLGALLLKPIPDNPKRRRKATAMKRVEAEDIPRGDNVAMCRYNETHTLDSQFFSVLTLFLVGIGNLFPIRLVWNASRFIWLGTYSTYWNWSNWSIEL